MNVVYQLVWSTARRILVVASELARNKRGLLCSRPIPSLLAVSTLMIAFGARAQVYWDGSGPFNDGTVNGGTGTWMATGLAWTNATGTANAA